jgi:hypothetical protein
MWDDDLMAFEAGLLALAAWMVATSGRGKPDRDG